jgi:hypothetical protein
MTFSWLSYTNKREYIYYISRNFRSECLANLPLLGFSLEYILAAQFTSIEVYYFKPFTRNLFSLTKVISEITSLSAMVAM